MQAAIDHLRQQKAQHLKWAQDLCRIPSISTKPEHKADVRKSVEWTRDACEKIGLSAKIMETGGHPLVYAECCKTPGAPTYLVYGHVDVQPTGDLSLWDADPFEPVVKGDWLICRGSSDDKGQVLLYLRAAEAWLKTEGKLPVNLKLLIEAEEEIGSPNLGTFIEKHKELLTCDMILISDTGLFEDNCPTITADTRGLVYKEVRLYGPKHDLHSGTHGGAVANPAIVLCDLIASLHDADYSVTIPGFYDGVVAPTDEVRKQIAQVSVPDAKYAQDLGVPGLSGEKGFTSTERRTIRPTLEVNGLTSGYQGEGANTIIPSKASAKISMRLVPGQNADKISEAFDAAVRKAIPATLRLEIMTHGRNADAYQTPLGTREFKAASQALKEAFGKETVVIREGGTLPILPMFKRVLGADSLMLGFASPACNAHGPNEKVNIGDLDRGAEAITRMFGLLGK